MSMTSDGVEETLETAIRASITAAARIGEALARLNQRLQQRAAEASAARTTVLRQRLDAGRAAARTAYRGVDDPSWWDTARPDEITTVLRTSRAWRSSDPEAARVYDKVTEEVLTRHGVDVRLVDVQAGPALDAAVEDLARKAEVDLIEATALLAAADAADTMKAGTEVDTPRGTERDQMTSLSNQSTVASIAPVRWDSAERRSRAEARLRNEVDHDQADRAIEAVMQSDIAQARPPADAVRRTQPSPTGRSQEGAAGRLAGRRKGRGLSR